MSLPSSAPWPRESILTAARAMAGGAGFAPALLAALTSPHADARRVVAAIHNAPSIALRVLKVANSAFYGHAGRVDALDRAVLVLGLDAVRTMASAACLDRVLPGADLAGGGPTASDLLNHSLATAVLARDLALLLLPERSADAFLAGLLHDLGYRVVQRLAGAPMGGCAGTGLRGHAQERAHDSGDHGEHDGATIARLWHGPCAALVFESWNLPGWLVGVVACHHRPADAAAELGTELGALTRIVAAAEHLAEASGHGLAVEPLSEEPWPLPELERDSPALTALCQQWPRSLATLNLALAC
jgi:HD-like signal output (HDOD) protein